MQVFPDGDTRAKFNGSVLKNLSLPSQSYISCKRYGVKHKWHILCLISNDLGIKQQYIQSTWTITFKFEYEYEYEYENENEHEYEIIWECESECEYESESEYENNCK
mgnify:CR=1 FL=1